MTTTQLATSRSPDAARTMLFAAAPLAAMLAGMAAQWLDFRALRYPILAMVLIGVTATALALFGRATGWRAFALTVALGIAAWGAAETLYVVLHVASGERFEAERFGPQPAQAVGLIAAHAAFLGAPTGLVAGLLRHALAPRFAPE